MPQIQVIGREAVDDQNNLVAQRQKQQEMLQNAEYNRGMLKYNSEHLKLMAKQTDNDAEKMRLQQEANDSDFVGKIFDIAMKSNDPQQTLMTAFSMYPERFTKVLGNKEFMDRASKLKPSGEEQYKTAMSNRLNALNGGAAGGGTMPGAGGALLTKESYGPSGGTFDFAYPDAMAALKTAEARATNLEDMSKEIAPAIGMIDALEGKWMKAFGNYPSKGIPIRAGIGKTAGILTQQDTDAASYMDTREAFLSRIVRALGEKGVLTNQDINRVKKALASQFTSKDLAIANFGTIRDIIKSGYEEYAKYGPAVGDIRPGKKDYSSAAPTTNSSDPLGVFQ